MKKYRKAIIYKNEIRALELMCLNYEFLEDNYSLVTNFVKIKNETLHHLFAYRKMHN